MLHRINCPGNQASIGIAEAALHNPYKRDEKEDLKTAIDALYEFKRKLNELHPVCVDVINAMLQQRF